MGDYSASHAVDYSFDSVSNIFEPDVILPSQFLQRDALGFEGGERKLMAALLSDGVEAYIAHATSGKQEKSEVCEWVETKDYGYVFSFDIVCDCLGINADYLRLGLSRYVDSVRAHQRLSVINGQAPKRAWKKIRRPRK